MTREDEERDITIKEMCKFVALKPTMLDAVKSLYGAGYRLMSEEITSDNLVQWFHQNDRWNTLELLKNFTITRKVN